MHNAYTVCLAEMCYLYYLLVTEDIIFLKNFLGVSMVGDKLLFCRGAAFHMDECFCPSCSTFNPMPYVWPGIATKDHPRR